MTKLSAQSIIPTADLNEEPLFFHLYKEGAPNTSYRMEAPVLSRTQSYHIPKVTNSPLENGLALVAALALSNALTPNGAALGSDNRAAVILLPGVYEVADSAFVLGTEYVDVIGIGAKGSVIITSEKKAVVQTASDVHIKNITIKTASADVADPAYYPNTALASTILEDVFFDAAGNSRPTRIDIDYQGRYIRCGFQNDNLFGAGTTTACSGTFIGCIGGSNSFGVTSAGNFTDCIGVNNSFGSTTASGNFTGCSSGNGSFGGTTSSGTFVRCSALNDSFGGAGTAAGTFTSCTGGNDCFGSTSAVGTFLDCHGLNDCFAAAGAASGNFTDCTAENRCFGGDGGSASGTFVRCDGLLNSFGVTAGGDFTDCTAQNESFGLTTASGNFIRCTGGNDCFGVTASGNFTDCTALNKSFGSTTASGVFVRCSAIGSDGSFGGNTGTATGTFTNCKSYSSSWVGVFTGLMDGCRWEVSGVDQTALTVASTARVYNSTLIGTGTGKSIDAGSAQNAAIAHCRMNLGIGVNVTNLIGTPYNVDDTDVS